LGVRWAKAAACAFHLSRKLIQLLDEWRPDPSATGAAPAACFPASIPGRSLRTPLPLWQAASTEFEAAKRRSILAEGGLTRLQAAALRPRRPLVPPTGPAQLDVVAHLKNGEWAERRPGAPLANKVPLHTAAGLATARITSMPAPRLGKTWTRAGRAAGLRRLGADDPPHCASIPEQERESLLSRRQNSR